MKIEIGKGKGIVVEFRVKKKEEETIVNEEKGKIIYYLEKDFEEEDLRKATTLLYKEAKKLKQPLSIKSLKGIKESRFIYLITEGLLLNEFELNYKSKKEKKKEIKVFFDVKKTKENKEALKKAVVLARAQNYARTLANLPPNIGTPERMKEEALKLAKSNKLKANVIDKKKMEKLGMNTILAVNSGSSKGAYLVELFYDGGGEKEFCVVGKGITFDSGGLQVKPAKYMLEMHLDKSGACVALGVIKAVSELKLKAKVRAIAVFTENMNGGNAYKPQTVVKSYSGKTIEIEHTDAEGRLILADALEYARRKKPSYIIDVATLTGAISVALGEHAIGLFSNNKELSKALKNAGEEEGERLWEFPMYKEYRKMLDSEVADIRNIGSWEGEAGSITAAKFLEEFVGKTKWAHLDIAGVMQVKTKPYLGTLGTASGVRTIIRAIEYLL